MKHKTILLLGMFMLSLTLSGQTIMDVARSKKLTWYGIDFSVAKFIKFEDKFRTDLVKNHLIKYWFDYTAKIDLAGKYDLKEVVYDTGTCVVQNSTIDFENIFADSFYEISNATIEKVLSKYPATGNGYGFLFIVESFEKGTEKVYIYVCYFRENDHKIISMRRYIGKAMGIGVENHYAGGITDVVKYSSKDFKSYKKH